MEQTLWADPGVATKDSSKSYIPQTEIELVRWANTASNRNTKAATLLGTLK
uniref:Uncharacterized protein n=1 Tax=Arundo donax TaxID=35708 RepID=A0A0A9CVY5_ARUDO